MEWVVGYDYFLEELSENWLENRNSNITTQLDYIFKAFSDFRLVAQIREEIEKVKISQHIVLA